MNHRLQFSGTIEAIQGVTPVRNGFRQTLHLKVPNENDSKWDQYFTIQLFSNSQTDSRFLHPKDVNTQRKCICYLKGQRWQGERGLVYNNKLELIEWIQ